MYAERNDLIEIDWHLQAKLRMWCESETDIIVLRWILRNNSLCLKGHYNFFGHYLKNRRPFFLNFSSSRTLIENYNFGLWTYFYCGIYKNTRQISTNRNPVRSSKCRKIFKLAIAKCDGLTSQAYFTLNCFHSSWSISIGSNNHMSNFNQ